MRKDDAIMHNIDEVVLRLNGLRTRILLAPVPRFLVGVCVFLRDFVITKQHEQHIKRPAIYDNSAQTTTVTDQLKAI